MKQVILSLILFAACCGCAGGSPSTQSQTNTQAPIAVTTTALPGAIKGSAYSATLTATGGTSPYNWSIASGQLPTGLTLSSTGTISGTPTASGEFNVTVQVTDSAATPATARARACAKTL